MPRTKKTDADVELKTVPAEDVVQTEETAVEEPTAEEQTAEEPVEEAAPAEETTAKDAEDTPEEEQTEEGTEEESAEKPAPKRRKKHSLANELGDEADVITTASKNRRKKLYKDANVFTINAEDKIEGEGTKARNDYIQLAASQKHGNVMYGELMSVGPIAGTDTIGAKVRYGSYTVIIPVDHLFVLDPKAVRDGDVANAQQYYASLRLGATIEFVVLGINEATKVAYASRMLAMQNLSKEYFITPESDGKPQIVAGMTVQGRICYVTKTGIGVDVFGAETFIPISELSWTRTYTLEMDEYNVGDPINVKILEIRSMDVQVNNQMFHLIDLSASVKQTIPNPNDQYFDYFNEGDRCIATVTQVTDSGYFVRLAGLRDALCDLTEGSIIPPGSKVQVKITKKVEEGKRIYASIRHIVKLAD